MYLGDKKQGDYNGFLKKWICYQREASKNYEERELRSCFLFSSQLYMVSISFPDGMPVFPPNVAILISCEISRSFPEFSQDIDGEKVSP